MPPIINTGLLTKDARSEFFNRLGSIATFWQDWATTLPSDKASENYRWLGTIPAMREWGTGRKAQGLRDEAYDVKNLKYESTLEVDRDELSDDQTGQIRTRINEMARRAAQHKDRLISDLLENGGTAGFNSYDGVTFFNNAHVSGVSGNQDNDLGATAVAPADPTTVEFKTAMRAAIAQMLGFKDDQGEPMSTSESGLVAVVPRGMMWNAREALNAVIIENTTNVSAGAADVKAFPYLASANMWYLLKTDDLIRPFILQDREPLEFTAMEKGSDEEFLREKYLFGVRARYRMTYGYWQFAIRTTFSV